MNLSARLGFCTSTLALLFLCGATVHAQDIVGGASITPANPTSKRKTKTTTRPRPNSGRTGGSNSSGGGEASAPSKAATQGTTSQTPAVVTSAAQPQPKVDLSEQLEDALELGNEQRSSNPPRYDAAERAYKLAAKLDAKDARAYAGLGNVYFDQKRYTDAETSYRRAIELNPADGSSYTSLALTYNALERYDEAERAASRAIALNPGEANGYVALAYSKYRRKDFKSAEAAYRRALELSPKSLEVYKSLISMLVEQKRYNDSVSLYVRALELSPSDASMITSYAIALQKLGRLEPAAEQYRRAAQADAKISTPRSNLGLIYYMQGDPAKARAEWQMAVQLGSSYPLDRIGLLILDKNLTEASAQLDQYTKSNAEDENGWLLLGDVRNVQGDEAQATAAYARAKEIAPDYAQIQRPTFLIAKKSAPEPQPPAKTVAKTEPSKASATPAKQTPAAPVQSGGKPTPRFASSVKVVQTTNFAQATPATGSLYIAVEANAVVLIEPVIGGEAQLMTADTVRYVAFNKLKPGEYRIVASLDGYPQVEVRAFVAATRVVSVKINFKGK